MVTELNQDNFEQEVLASDGLVLVDFYAVWCGPCQMLAPHIDALADEYPSLKVCRLDVDAAGAIAAQFGITSIPTLIFFRNGAVEKMSVGYLTPDALRKMAEALL